MLVEHRLRGCLFLQIGQFHLRMRNKANADHGDRRHGRQRDFHGFPPGLRAIAALPFTKCSLCPGKLIAQPRRCIKCPMPPRSCDSRHAAGVGRQSPLRRWYLSIFRKSGRRFSAENAPATNLNLKALKSRSLPGLPRTERLHRDIQIKGTAVSPRRFMFRGASLPSLHSAERLFALRSPRTAQPEETVR